MRINGADQDESEEVLLHDDGGVFVSGINEGGYTIRVSNGGYMPTLSFHIECETRYVLLDTDPERYGYIQLLRLTVTRTQEAILEAVHGLMGI